MYCWCRDYTRSWSFVNLQIKSVFILYPLKSLVCCKQTAGQKPVRTKKLLTLEMRRFCKFYVIFRNALYGYRHKFPALSCKISLTCPKYKYKIILEILFIWIKIPFLSDGFMVKLFSSLIILFWKLFLK